jgi:hypothetical protein
MVCRASDINDPMRCTKRCGRGKECLPVSTASGGEDLGASRTTVFVFGFTHILAIRTLHHGTGRVGSVEGDTPALAPFGAASERSRFDFFDPTAFGRGLALCQSWEW